MGLVSTSLRFAGSWLSPAGAGARLSILIYHRVLPQPDPLRKWEIDAATFDAHMRALAQHFTPLPLFEAVERLKSHNLPARAACVTFDDGYADNIEVALPILQRHGISATFFIATGYLDGGRMWNDTITDAVGGTPQSQLDLSSLGLGSFPLTSIQERQTAILALLNRLKHLPSAERAGKTLQIGSLSGAILPDNLMMCTEQVRGLHQAGMEIGGHTVSHPILLNLPDKAAHKEIADGKARLEDIIGVPLRLFAYPNGKPGKDYAPAHVAIVKQLGFSAAVSTTWGAASSASDAYQLPRFTPWDKSPRRFVLRLLQNYRNR